MQVISIKKNPKYKAGGQPKKWLKGVELADEWGVSPSQISRLAYRKTNPLPADFGLGRPANIIGRKLAVGEQKRINASREWSDNDENTRLYLDASSYLVNLSALV